MRQPSSRFITLGGHVAICASLPPGCAEAVEARSVLSALLSEAGTLPSLDCVGEDRCRVVRHLDEGAARHRPNVMFVGSVSQTVGIS